MKSLLLLLLALTVTAAHAQTPATSSQDSEIRVVAFYWRSDRVHPANVSGGGGGSPHNMEYTLPGGTSVINPPKAPLERGDAGKSSTGINSYRPVASKATVDSLAVLSLENNGTKTVKVAYADFVFTDPTTKVEFLRYSFKFKKKIAPAATKKFENIIWQKVGKNRKAFTPAKPKPELIEQTNSAALSVVLNRVEFTDGTFWQRN